jgi:hypothetical protein
VKLPRHALPFAVTTAAAAISARHIYAVAYEASNPWWSALLHAVALDGLIYIGVYAMQDRRWYRGGIALSYGMIVSALFNADSYQAMQLDPLFLAFCIPLAVLIGFLAATGQDTGHGTGQDNAQDRTTHRTGQDRATRTAVGVHLSHESVPSVSRPAVLSHAVVPSVTGQVVPSDVPLEIASRPARMSRVLSATDRAAIAAEIDKGETNNREIARRVFGQDAGDRERKQVERLRAKL